MYDIKYTIRLLREHLDRKPLELPNKKEYIKGCQRLTDLRKDLKILSLPLPFLSPPSRKGCCDGQAHFDVS